MSFPWKRESIRFYIKDVKCLEKKVVVKYQNGKIIKGWVEEFQPDRNYFTFYPLIESGQEENVEDNFDSLINFDSLKAVFFVKDFAGNKDYQKVRTFDVELQITPSQRKLIVNFKDGEKLYGSSLTYGRYKVGYFVSPVDPKDNNERIFVVHSAVESVRLMKIKI